MALRKILLTALFALTAAQAQAAPPTVEIVAMAHPPVKAALAPLRTWLSAQGGKLRVVEIDADTPAGGKRLAAVGLRGHIPVVILIDGQYRLTGPDGRKHAFYNFPNIEGAPPAVRGAWTTNDVQTVLKGLMK